MTKTAGLTASITAGLAAGLVGLMATVAPVRAGDMNNGGAGGIKDYGSAGIAVPAPVPYNETFKYYVRGDIGASIKSQGTIDTGPAWPIVVNQPDNWRENSVISFGFGRYVTPSLRVEGTVDYRPERKLGASNKILPDTQASAVTGTTTVGTTTVTVVSTNIYSGVENEAVSYSNGSLLASAFYDFNAGGRFRPYIGGGVGLAIHDLKRNGADVYTCYTGYQTNYFPNGTTTPGVQGLCTSVAASATSPGLPSQFAITSNTTAIGYGLAAQLSAGLSYDLTARTHWDTGYRMMWQSGRVGVASMNGVSVLKLNDTIGHEIRTGVRWDIW